MDYPIFLVGFRAVGKTTVGKALALKMGFDFLDTDRLVCQKNGCSIGAIVKEEGWKGFRSLEEEVLQSLVGCTKCVVASGGGAVLHQRPWEQLRKRSLIVWLSAPPEVLFGRLRHDAGSDENRPSLTGRNTYSELIDILRQREPLYSKTAHLEIAAGGRHVSEIVEIIQQIYLQNNGRGKQ